MTLTECLNPHCPWGCNDEEEEEMKIPRLLYWEDAVGAWCPVLQDVSTIIDISNLLENEEKVIISFKRIDMTDEEFNNLPDE